MDSWLKNKQVLVTGGTSGLGRSLVSQLLKNQCRVISVARSDKILENVGDSYAHINCDFAELSSINEVIDKLVDMQVCIDILINNAGILSPPEYQESKNAMELSFQVNFLSHVYLTRELINTKLLNPSCIINISSPIHTRGQLNLAEALNPDSYSMLKAYANTKLYMALYSQILVDMGYKSFSYDPGTFSSGIYRQQKLWFRNMYKVAAPFMTSSDRVAKGLLRIILAKTWEDGKMMNRHGKQARMLSCDEQDFKGFWSMVDQMLDQIRNELGHEMRNARPY